MSILSINDGRKFEFEPGLNLLKVLKKNNIMIENPCEGKGYCGKCKVRIIEGLKDNNLEEHEKFLSKEEILDNIRLSCLYTLSDNICIELINEDKKEKILDSGYLPEFKVSSIVEKTKQVILSENLEGNNSLENMISSRNLNIDILRKIPNIKVGDTYTIVTYSGDIVSLEYGDTTKLKYGFAVDIGTTTVVVSLLNLNTGEEISTASAINPQKNYGLDVLSRINYASKEEYGTEELNKVLINCLNNLFEELCIKNNVSIEYIYDITISGNTTMLHLLLGINPKSLGINPYKPVFKSSKTLWARDLGLNTTKITKVYCLPSVSAFIGSDITSGAIVCNLNETKEKVLFIDIGTNGEMILADNGSLVACSCAAGPALEGMNITCGVRAGLGAIEGVKIERSSMNLDIIGNEKASGICGSGILDSISEFHRVGLVNKSGRIKKKIDLKENPFLESIVIEDGSKRSILLSKENNIVVTQSDIRQVQLAKGAILSGIIALSKHLELDIKDIDRVIIAGQFGLHLKIESLLGIGMVPKDLEHKINYIGNSSKSGAILCLLDKYKREEANKVLDNCRYIELSLLEDYEKLFAKCLSLDIGKGIY